MNIRKINEHFGIDLDDSEDVKGDTLYRVVSYDGTKRGGMLSEYARISDDIEWIGDRCKVFEAANLVGGEFEGGKFYGGYFRGGYFFEGTFYDGEFNGGEFWGGVFEDGVFNGGKFEGCVVHSGVFDSGEFRGGHWDGGFLTSVGDEE